MLSMQRPLPSMLIMTSCRFKVPVKSLLVNWLPWVGIEDFRSAIARERFLERFDAKIGVERVGEAPGEHRAAHPVHDHRRVKVSLVRRRVSTVAYGRWKL
jgi:hypothetical protein